MRARTVLGAIAAIAIVIVGAGPVAAHVSWTPKEATTGAAAELRLRVPNERDDAATTKVELAFPPGHLLDGVTAPATDGWTASVEGTPVTRITWTATGGGLTGDDTVELPVAIGSVGGNGGGEHLFFKALQTYSDGEVVRWIDEPAPGGAEAEHPAPVLVLNGEPTAAPSTTAPPSTTAADDLDDESDGPPVILLVILIVAAAAITAAVVVNRRRPPRSEDG